MSAGPATGAELFQPAALSRFEVTVGGGGVVLGRDQRDQPMTVRLFRDRLTQVALVTCGYVARLIAVRALATGAAVHVATSLGQRWEPVISTAPQARAMLVSPGAPLPAGASPGTPLLRCDDIGPAASPPLPDGGGAVGAWQTRIVVQDLIPATAVATLRAYDLLVLQRVRPELVQPLQSTFGLPAQLADALPALPDDMVVMLAPGAPGRATAVWLAPTEFETWLLGAPVRLEG